MILGDFESTSEENTNDPLHFTKVRFCQNLVENGNTLCPDQMDFNIADFLKGN